MYARARARIERGAVERIPNESKQTANRTIGIWPQWSAGPIINSEYCVRCKQGNAKGSSFLHLQIFKIICIVHRSMIEGGEKTMDSFSSLPAELNTRGSYRMRIHVAGCDDVAARSSGSEILFVCVVVSTACSRRGTLPIDYA